MSRVSRGRPRGRPVLATARHWGIAHAQLLASEIEDYASYQPPDEVLAEGQARHQVLGRWLVNRQGGGFGGISRSLQVRRHLRAQGGPRLRLEPRRARRKADRQRAAAFLAQVRQTDKAGNTDAKARRMGIMYIIWNDHMYSACDRSSRSRTT